MKFQLGLELKGLTSCSQTDNDFNIAYLISNLSKYPNVVTISVGNETSFFSKFMPLPCLEDYIRTIRAQVTQPVTDRRRLDFLRRQVGRRRRPGPGQAGHDPAVDRFRLHPHVSVQLHGLGLAADQRPRGAGARAGHDGDLARCPEGVVRRSRRLPVRRRGRRHGERRRLDAHHRRRDRLEGPADQPCSGDRALCGAASEPEVVLRPAVRQPGGYESWQGSVGGPPTIFFFEGYDEQWKGIDDGWGLWNIDRQARYALCGTPAGPACNDDLYEGAGFSIQQCLSARSPSTRPTSTTRSLVSAARRTRRWWPTRSVEPTRLRGSTGRMRPWSFAGTVVGTTGATVGIIPFDADNTRMTVRVYSPAAGIPVRLKVEDSADPADPHGWRPRRSLPWPTAGKR